MRFPRTRIRLTALLKKLLHSQGNLLEIKKQIELIQGSTRETATDIRQGMEVISEVNEIVGTIVSSVQEQAAATREIAENISNASQGITDINERVSQSSGVVHEISDEIKDVSANADDAAQSSRQVDEQAVHLKGLADKLTAMVVRFRV